MGTVHLLPLRGIGDNGTGDSEMLHPGLFHITSWLDDSCGGTEITSSEETGDMGHHSRYAYGTEHRIQVSKPDVHSAGSFIFLHDFRHGQGQMAERRTIHYCINGRLLGYHVLYIPDSGLLPNCSR